MINTLDITIWSRAFSLPVEYDCYEGETVTREQIEAIQRFIKHMEWLEQAKKSVEKFCKDQVKRDKENDKKDNIFSYVKPEYVFVKRDEKQPRVALMCKYRYDLEHGLAIVFSSDGKISVGSQDIIL
ncbi:MAG: hypothetical protein IJF05_06355 [Clostridia bacterium]|nr:hypothetical protein [Clostridia bacterium]